MCEDKIICWGDSLTEGAGGQYAIDNKTVVECVTYPDVIAELSGRQVINKARGGESATQIAIRQGGVKLLVDEEFTIPEETEPVEMKVKAGNGVSLKTNYGVSFGKNGLGTVSCDYLIDGISGLLTATVDGFTEPDKPDEYDYRYYFTRHEKGDIHTVKSGTQIVSADSLEFNDGIAIFWIGANGGWVREDVPDDANTYETYIKIIDQMIAQLKGDEKRFIVIGLSTEGDMQRSEMDSLLRKTYGDRFISIRKLLSCDKDIYTKKGIDLSDRDKALMEQGIVPQCIRIDGIHYNSVGYRIIGELIYGEVVKLGLL